MRGTMGGVCYSLFGKIFGLIRYSLKYFGLIRYSLKYFGLIRYSLK